MNPRHAAETLLLGMLRNVETWADDLRQAPGQPQPWGAVRHTIANMDQAARALRSMLELPPPDQEP